MSDHIPNKSLGQHWLHDEATLDAIVEGAAVTSADTVVEIGPGLGTLTAKLLATGATVIAIEYDESLLGGLKAKFANHPKFELIYEDILRYDFSLLKGDYKIVANIPYYLTSQLLRILSDMPNKPIVADLLMQKEVTERVCASPGDMSILSVAVQTEYDTSVGVYVPAHLFTPRPKVDSLVLHMQKRGAPLVGPEHRSEFMRVIKAGFSAKRKMIRNTMSAGLHIPKQTTDALLAVSKIEGTRRAETLSLEEWLAVYTNYLGTKA